MAPPSKLAAASAPMASTSRQVTALGDLAPQGLELKTKEKSKKVKPQPKKKNKSHQAAAAQSTPPDKPPEKILASLALQASSQPKNRQAQLQFQSSTLTAAPAQITVTAPVMGASDGVGASGAELSAQITAHLLGTTNF